MTNKQDAKSSIDKGNVTWIMFAMFLFTITKMTALICATYIAAKVNVGVGSVLFIAAIMFRITWTYLPNKSHDETGNNIPDTTKKGK